MHLEPVLVRQDSVEEEFGGQIGSVEKLPADRRMAPDEVSKLIHVLHVVDL